MKTTATGASDDRQKMIAMAAFVVIAAAIFYFEYFDAGAPAAPASPIVATTPTSSALAASTAVVPIAAKGPAAKVVGTSLFTLDPTLHMDPMLASESVVYSGSGRNIFSMNSAPPPGAIPQPIARARPIAPPVFVPCPPNCPQPIVRPPPPIELKFFGVVTSASGARQAFLLHDDTVYTASAGDVVMRRYRVIAVEANSIQVEDLQNNNKQTLPRLMN